MSTTKKRINKKANVAKPVVRRRLRSDAWAIEAHRTVGILIEHARLTRGDAAFSVAMGFLNPGTDKPTNNTPDVMTMRLWNERLSTLRQMDQIITEARNKVAAFA